MNAPKLDKVPLGNSDDDNKSSIDAEKQTVGKIFGYEISAPKTTKNPLIRLVGLLLLNIFLLIVFRMALNR